MGGIAKFERCATWTYVINDQPFGDFGERLAKALVQHSNKYTK